MNRLELTLTRFVLGLVAFVAQRFSIRDEVLFASSRDRVLGPQLAALSRAIRDAAPGMTQRLALAPYGYGIRAKLLALADQVKAHCEDTNMLDVFDHALEDILAEPDKRFDFRQPM